MIRCPGEAEEAECVHGEIGRPLRIVWFAVEERLADPWVVREWEDSDEVEAWARSRLLLPEGYRWASEELVFHVGTTGRWRRHRWVLPVVVSRAVELDVDDGS